MPLITATQPSVESLSLRAVATHLHVAPPPGMIFAAVDEQPAVGPLNAFANVITVRRRKQVSCGVDNGPQRSIWRLVRSREPRMKSGLRQMTASGTNLHIPHVQRGAQLSSIEPALVCWLAHRIDMQYGSHHLSKDRYLSFLFPAVAMSKAS